MGIYATGPTDISERQHSEVKKDFAADQRMRNGCSSRRAHAENNLRCAEPASNAVKVCATINHFINK